MKSLKHDQFLKKTIIKKNIDIIQINIGNKCNQVCAHCHVEASPYGDKNMDEAVALKIIDKISVMDVDNIEFTGGAPELNPYLKVFLEKLSEKGKTLTVRTNLTVLDTPECREYLDLYVKYNVKLISSLPSIFEDVTDLQRGEGTYSTSIKILRLLNERGYGEGDFSLDLVYNPNGDFLPQSQSVLEDKYRRHLDKNFDIRFNNLLTIVNSPIKRFKEYLIHENRYNDYVDLLKKRYNPATVDKLMCNNVLSVDYQGYVYDCDFCQAVSKRVKGYEQVKFWDIDFNNFNPPITLYEHCYACTVDTGSSCHGALIKEQETGMFDVKSNTKEYYGEILKDATDLKTSACCTLDAIPTHIKQIIGMIADEIVMKYYGCGSPLPLVLDGLNVLDLGCGTGRDVYVLSKLVGESGKVYGIDMTENQINVASKYRNAQAKRFGYAKSNVVFIKDEMEKIDTHFESKTFDLVISNCVINLAEDKGMILKKIHHCLKNGGEFYFSDVYADRRIPADIVNDPVIHGECLGGALYINDFIRMARKAGFMDPRVVSQREIGIDDERIADLVGNIRFYSITYRLWKLEGLEDKCEDYGHVVIYKGGIEHAKHKYQLDGGHIFYKNMPERVCGNTALMLSQTRLRDYFTVIGSFNEHFGEFKDCGGPGKAPEENTGTSACC